MVVLVVVEKIHFLMAKYREPSFRIDSEFQSCDDNRDMTKLYKMYAVVAKCQVL